MEQAFEFDPGTMRRWIGPHSVRAMLDQVLMNLWMFTPPEDKKIETVCERATQVVAEAMVWWQRQEKSRPDQVEPAAELNLSDFKSNDGARFAARSAISTCWNLLPESRRTDGEPERIVRQMLERSLSLFKEDAELFEHPLR